MKDAYYFPHDSNARSDEKCLYIISKYGAAGYGLYWMFIETMHEQGDGKLTCELLEGLSFSYNTDITLLKQFYNDAIKAKLFITDGEKYWSERVLKNKSEFEEKKKIKSEAGKRGMQSRWGTDNTVITKNNTVITNHNKGKESKGKESKGNNKKSIYGEFSHVSLTHEEYLKLYSEYQNAGELIKFLDEYIEMKGYKAKSHYLCIKKWVADAVNERKNKKLGETKDNVFTEIGRDMGIW